MKILSNFGMMLAVICGLALVSPGRADLIKLSTAYTRTVLMVSSSDHITGATGLTLTVTESKAGGAFAASGATVTEIANGWYKIILATTDTSALGAFNLHVTATGADPTDTADQIVAFDPTSATNLGLTALPTANPAASGGLITVGAGSGQLNPNGSGGLSNIAYVVSGTAQAGGSSSITLQVSGSSSVTDFYKGDYVLTTGGTGVGQARTITAYNATTQVATLSRPWATNPDNTTTYTIVANPHPAPDANLAVTTGTLTDANQIASQNAVTTINTKLGTPVASVSGDIAALPTVASIWNAAAASYNTAGSMGQKVNSAGSAGNPWTTDISTGYTGTQAGALLYAIRSGQPVTLPSSVVPSGDITNIVTAMLGATVDSGGGHTVTVKDSLLLSFMGTLGGFGTATRSTSSPWTITVPFLRLDGTTTGWTYVTTYTDNTFSKAVSRTFSPGTLP